MSINIFPHPREKIEVKAHPVIVELKVMKILKFMKPQCESIAKTISNGTIGKIHMQSLIAERNVAFRPIFAFSLTQLFGNLVN